MPEPRFTRQTHVRCEDCDIRGDLTAAGLRAPHSRARIHSCGGCGGHGELPPESPRDPYDSGIDASDPYAAKRLRRAAEANRVFTHSRAARRLFFEALKAETLMLGELGNA